MRIDRYNERARVHSYTTRSCTTRHDAAHMLAQKCRPCDAVARCGFHRKLSFPAETFLYTHSRRGGCAPDPSRPCALTTQFIYRYLFVSVCVMQFIMHAGFMCLWLCMCVRDYTPWRQINDLTFRNSCARSAADCKNHMGTSFSHCIIRG